MEKHSIESASVMQKAIYIVLIGSAAMADIDSLILSLDRFKSILSSDSAKERFETTLRSIQPTITAVDAFLDAVYAEKNPMLSVNMTGRSLIVEVALTKEEFLKLVNAGEIKKILAKVIAVGTMPAKKPPTQKLREYKVFPVKHENGMFIKTK